MRNFLLTALCCIGTATIVAGCASKQPYDHPDAGAYRYSATPVNTICPIGKEGYDEGTELVAKHDGFAVAFCCAGCAEYWEGLDADKKTEFIELALQDRDNEFETD